MFDKKYGEISFIVVRSKSHMATVSKQEKPVRYNTIFRALGLVKPTSEELAEKKRRKEILHWELKDIVYLIQRRRINRAVEKWDWDKVKKIGACTDREDVGDYAINMAFSHRIRSVLEYIRIHGSESIAKHADDALKHFDK